MEKCEIVITFGNAQVEALEYYLKKENTSVQKRMNEAFAALYEKTVPEPVRDYLDSRTVQTKTKRPPRPDQPKPRTETVKIAAPKLNDESEAHSEQP